MSEQGRTNGQAGAALDRVRSDSAGRRGRVRMCGRTLCVLTLLAAMLGGGCVAQSNVDQLRADNNALRDELEVLKARIREADAAVLALQNADPEPDPQLVAALNAARDELRAQKARYEAALAEAERRFAELADQRVELPSATPRVLPEEVDRQLVALARTHPFMSYDAARGMVKIDSSLTFNTGSTALSDEAVQSLRQLAGILNGDAAAPYEVRIVGHTDNVRMANPANVAKFEDNWGLSAFRAISVMRVLASAQVDPVRMAVVGHGEFRPVVPNTPGGTRANRRVEIYLVPTEYEAPSGGAGASAGGGEAPVPVVPMPPASTGGSNVEPDAFK